MIETNVRLFTAGLLSKWGFNDGAVLDDILFDAGYTRAGGFYGAVLQRVVTEFVLPALAPHHTITTYRITTNHNPIRAQEVDGVAASDSQGIALSPEFVDVPLSEVVRVASETSALYEPPGTPCPESPLWP